jgi:hypothetical protein
MARSLAQFSIIPDGKGDYVLNLEDEDGETIEFIAGVDQLDLITEAIDEVLEAEDDDLLVEADDDEEPEE